MKRALEVMHDNNLYRSFAFAKGAEVQRAGDQLHKRKNQALRFCREHHQI